jgi:hypothetical protein
VTPLYGQSSDDIEFDPAITQEEFSEFSRLVAQGIYATPIEPARARGLLGFDIGIGATALPIDTQASYWVRAVDEDFTVSDYLPVPRVIVTKGLSFGTIGASYSKVPDTDITVLGGSFDFPLIRGGIATPALTLRGAYSQLKGIEQYDLTTYGVEVFLAKGFGPITPYVAAGRVKSDAEGRVPLPDDTTLTLTDESTGERYTIGVKISMLLPKLVIEATQAEERSYAAKVSFGF